jgi:hypothetical protein
MGGNDGKFFIVIIFNLFLLPFLLFGDNDEKQSPKYLYYLAREP